MYRMLLIGFVLLGLALAGCDSLATTDSSEPHADNYYGNNPACVDQMKRHEEVPPDCWR